MQETGSGGSRAVAQLLVTSKDLRGCWSNTRVCRDCCGSIGDTVKLMKVMMWDGGEGRLYYMLSASTVTTESVGLTLVFLERVRGFGWPARLDLCACSTFHFSSNA